MKPTILASDNSDSRGPVSLYGAYVKHLSGKHDQTTHNPSSNAGSDFGDQAAGRAARDRIAGNAAATSSDPSASPRDKIAASERGKGAKYAMEMENRRDMDAFVVRHQSMLSRRKLTPDQKFALENFVAGAREVYSATFPDAQY